jgi:hypoxanthine phosphoribosyltransferase
MILYTEEQIQDRLKYLAYELSRDFDEVTLLITLTGGMYTATDLSKYLTIPCKFEFVKVSSYGDEEESGIVELKWISANKGSDLGNVIIIDDICDTGKTLDYLIKYLKNNYTYNTIRSLALLDKQGRRETFVELDYKGFSIPNYFVYGYGMDRKGYDRNLTDIETETDVK